MDGLKDCVVLGLLVVLMTCMLELEQELAILARLTMALAPSGLVCE